MYDITCFVCLKSDWLGIDKHLKPWRRTCRTLRLRFNARVHGAGFLLRDVRRDVDVGRGQSSDRWNASHTPLMQLRRKPISLIQVPLLMAWTQPISTCHPQIQNLLLKCQIRSCVDSPHCSPFMSLDHYIWNVVFFSLSIYGKCFYVLLLPLLFRFFFLLFLVYNQDRFKGAPAALTLVGFYQQRCWARLLTNRPLERWQFKAGGILSDEKADI